MAWAWHLSWRFRVGRHAVENRFAHRGQRHVPRPVAAGSHLTARREVVVIGEGSGICERYRHVRRIPSETI